MQVQHLCLSHFQYFCPNAIGQLFAILFFVSVAFAGITSLLNMFEAVSESWQTRFNLSRKDAVTLVLLLLYLSAYSLKFLRTKIRSLDGYCNYLYCSIWSCLGAFSIYYILGYKEIRQELELARNLSVLTLELQLNISMYH